MNLYVGNTIGQRSCRVRPFKFKKKIGGIACGKCLLRIPSIVFMVSSSIFILSTRKSLDKK
jgi:hypothetical protein